MAKSITTQGINRLRVYSIDADHTSASIGASPIITFDYTRNTQLQPQDDGSYTLTLDSLLDGEEFWDFYAQYRTVTASGGGDDAFFEDGTKIPAIGSASTPSSGSLDLLVICPMAIEAGTTPRIRTFISLMNLRPASGQHTVQWQEYSNFPVEFSSVKAKANITVPATCFDTAIFASPTGTATLPLDSHGEMIFKNRA